MTQTTSNRDYEIKRLGSYLQDLGKYLIENPEKIRDFEITYFPLAEYKSQSFISYENSSIITIKVETL